MTIKRKTFMDAVLIAPGIVVPVMRTESAMEAYRRQQFECPHTKRDPRGTCYACGQRTVEEKTCPICHRDCSKHGSCLNGGLR